MAQRRMFSLKIIDTDNFLDMPTSTQLLYFHLAMRADDDGFVSNPKKIIKMVNCSADDFKLLIAKQYIIPFESGICVIKDWKIHNYIQNDRYTQTIYQDEKSKLETTENGEYRTCIQYGYNMDTQVRLGKDSIGKDSIYILPTNKENEFYEVPEDIKDLLKTTYTKINLEEEFKKIKAWLVTNKLKRKTLSGMPRFLNSWFSNASNPKTDKKQDEAEKAKEAFLNE